MAGEPDDVVRFCGVVKRLGDVPALDGVVIAIGRGKVVGGHRSSRALSLVPLNTATALRVWTGTRAIARRDSRTV